ncbi:hypothetical protein ACWD4V_01200 [Streptomyces tsukubensis]
MLLITLTDGTESLNLDDRPTGDDYEPLPYGLTLDHVAAVRARDVEAGDLVVADFPDNSGIREARHMPVVFLAAPHRLGDCPCEGCGECSDMDERLEVDGRRAADLDWRYVCLAPSEDGEPCALTLRARPVAVIRADRVAAARVAAARALPPTRDFSVTWRADFEARDAMEAILLAYEQIRSYADRGVQAPELVAYDGRETVTVDLGTVGA